MSEGLKERKLLFLVRTRKDKQAFGELYDLYVEKIYRFVYFKINNKEEAEDLTSEVFLKTWNYLIEYAEKEIDSFSGLIYRISRNAIVDFYRKKARHNECNIDTFEDTLVGKSDVQGIEDGYDVEKLMIIIKKMKQEYQEVILLKHVEELSVAEIAQILDKTRTGVRVTLHRAMKKLKDLSSKN